MSKTTRINGSRDGRKAVIASLPWRSRAFLKVVEFSSTFFEPERARKRTFDLDLRIQIEDMEHMPMWRVPNSYYFSDFLMK